MRFDPTRLQGAYVIGLDPIEDERGFFARSFCAREFETLGLVASYPQCNISFNKQSGTLRGMHYSVPPGAEAKLVRCTRGAVYDVIVDLREGSPTRLQSFAVELSADNRKAIYIPEGFAHGFQTLADDTEVFYQMGAAYLPEAQRACRYDDPELGIQWPRAVSMISERDAQAPLLRDVKP